MKYTNEYKILSDLSSCLNDELPEIDPFLLEKVSNYLDNPFNMSDEDIKYIEDFIANNKKEEIKLDVQILGDNKDFEKKVTYMKPCKLNKPTAPIKRMYGKSTYTTVIPVCTKVKELKLAA